MLVKEATTSKYNSFRNANSKVLGSLSKDVVGFCYFFGRPSSPDISQDLQRLISQRFCAVLWWCAVHTHTNPFEPVRTRSSIFQPVRSPFVHEKRQHFCVNPDDKTRTRNPFNPYPFKRRSKGVQKAFKNRSLAVREGVNLLPLRVSPDYNFWGPRQTSLGEIWRDWKINAGNFAHSGVFFGRLPNSMARLLTARSTLSDFCWVLNDFARGVSWLTCYSQETNRRTCWLNVLQLFDIWSIGATRCPPSTTSGLWNVKFWKSLPILLDILSGEVFSNVPASSKSWQWLRILKINLKVWELIITLKHLLFKLCCRALQHSLRCCTL